MLFTYHTKPLLDFVDRHGSARNPEHVWLRACLATAVECNAIFVQLTPDEHDMIVGMELEQRPTTLTDKEPHNDNRKT